MPDAVCIVPSERLPWLPNAAPAPKRRGLDALAASAAVVATSAAAVAAMWSWAAHAPEIVAVAPAAQPAGTIALPPPVAATPVQAEPQGASAGERAALAPQPPAAAPRKAKSREIPARSASATGAYAPASAPAYQARAWRSGVPGRIIQLGAFRTSAQAQSEWKRVYYRYPLLRPLPPRVIRSKIRGRNYYRLQLGTFSQAHSELLCQRLRTLGEGCMVLGLRGRRG